MQKNKMTDLGFKQAILRAHRYMCHSSVLVNNASWQGVDISSKPEMSTYEVEDFFMVVPVDGYRDPEGVDLPGLVRDIGPNIPWADDHFAERVCGEPINPGVEWKNWPYAHSAERFLDNKGKFNHNYMERYWPKKAGLDCTDGGIPATKTAEEQVREFASRGWHNEFSHRGIRGKWGDLDDVVEQIARDPTTRQAILPVFFPEDTGAINGGRVPCSIFYHFMIRDGALTIRYYLRSCDLMRHFRDDIYLTVRLQIWMSERLKQKNSDFEKLKLGSFGMWIGSLHVFRNDFKILFPHASLPAV